MARGGTEYEETHQPSLSRSRYATDFPFQKMNLTDQNLETLGKARWGMAGAPVPGDQGALAA
jgi:hypothetical protein